MGFPVKDLEFAMVSEASKDGGYLMQLFELLTGSVDLRPRVRM